MKLKMNSRVLLLTGMSPDPRIYDRLLPSHPTATILPWIDPLPGESISRYAARLAKTVAIAEPKVVCGVSFGGIVARELASQLNAKSCVLISSIRSPRELPPLLRAVRPFVGPYYDPMLNLVGTMASAIPRGNRTHTTIRLTKLAGRSGSWHRWAGGAVLRWKPSADLDRIPTVQIHGSRDTTFPLKYVHPNFVVEGGSHTMVLTHAAEISEIISRVAA